MTNTLTAEQKLETAIHNAMNDTVHMDDDSENAWQKAVSAIALAVAPFVSPDLPSPPVSGVAAWSLVDPLPTSRGHSFGDWRDIRACLEALVVDYMSLPDDTRDALWKFAEALPKVHPAMTFNCAECGKTFSRIDQYRCADCHATCCENCIRPHFGPEHKPHLSPLTNEPVGVTRLRYEPAYGDTLADMRKYVSSNLKASGDLRLVWANDGDLGDIALSAAIGERG